MDLRGVSRESSACHGVFLHLDRGLWHLVAGTCSNLWRAYGCGLYHGRLHEFSPFQDFVWYGSERGQVERVWFLEGRGIEIEQNKRSDGGLGIEN